VFIFFSGTRKTLVALVSSLCFLIVCHSFSVPVSQYPDTSHLLSVTLIHSPFLFSYFHSHFQFIPCTANNPYTGYKFSTESKSAANTHTHTTQHTHHTTHTPHNTHTTHTHHTTHTPHNTHTHTYTYIHIHTYRHHTHTHTHTHHTHTHTVSI
jgi:hypothetical protein